MIPPTLALAAATLASEDLACLAAGVLIAQGALGFLEGALACAAGIFVGDLLLFLGGRLGGRRVLRWRPLARLLPRETLERGARWLDRRGLAVVFLSRFTPGLRLPTYFAAGLLPVRTGRFVACLFLASAVWTPLLVGAAAASGDGLFAGGLAQRGRTLPGFVLVLGVLALAMRLLRAVCRKADRRRLAGFWKRAVEWEFWPPWAAYLPLAPYFLYLAVRHRSLTLFTAANPGIPSGGFAGESKSAILSRLGGAAAAYTVIPADLEPAARIQLAWRFLREEGLEFPVVLKPDTGERGRGVSIVRTAAALASYLERASTDIILQQYVPGVEFGVFYYRYPHEASGRIFSITEKRFPAVTGDGRATLRELILRDRRAAAIARTYEKLAARPLDEAPAAGENVPLAEIGSHCRGAIFLNGARLLTPALEEAVDRIARAHPGFCFGRFDVRAPSTAAFAAGHFTVIELNGVSAEATHIYDPSVSWLETYRVMFRQWRIAFGIGEANRARGTRPMPLGAFLALVARHLRGGRRPPSGGRGGLLTLAGGARPVRHLKT